MSIIGPGLLQLAVTWATKGPSYRDARDRLDLFAPLLLSHETIRQALLEVGACCERNSQNKIVREEGQKEVDALFIKVDGFGARMQKNRKRKRGNRRHEAKMVVMGTAAQWRKNDYELVNPTYILWLALSMIWPPTWSSVKVYFGVVTILSFLDWTGLARVVRGQFLTLRAKEFVEGAVAIGVSDGGIIFRHILPNIMSYLIVSATLFFPGMIIGESSISFLGLGIKEPMTSWGLLLKDAQSMDVLLMQSWLMIPGIFIIISVLAFNFMGDALRDAFDPYST